MPSVSQRQQRYFGMIAAGKIKKPGSMTDKQVHDFAATPRKGLPQHMADGALGAEGKMPPYNTSMTNTGWQQKESVRGTAQGSMHPNRAAWMKRMQEKAGTSDAAPPDWMERSRGGSDAEHMADGRTGDGNWMEKAFKPENKGKLHKALGIPQGETIPQYKVKKAAGAPGHLGQMARVAENARR